MVKLFFSFFFCAWMFIGQCQDSSFYVINPLPIKPALSGSFGELRSNHFHGGIDLKTAGKEGMEVMAAAPGYISRIKISPYGYGRAIYIDHPEGYTTVYGHLRDFNPAIAAYIKQAQLASESFEIDVYPGQSELPVKRGEVIAYSGNTGGSGGPHLHFEVRETVTEVPRNPLLFGFPLQDNIRPSIRAIALEPIGEGARVNGSDHTLRASVSGSGINARQPIKINGAFSVGVNGFDQFSGSLNQNGFYKLSLFADSLLVSTFIADSIPFHQSRYINAQIDYEHYYMHRSRFLRLFRLPGNYLEAGHYKRQDGIIALDPGTYTIELKAEDVDGNQDKVAFKVRVEPALNQAPIKMTRPMLWDADNYYETSATQVVVPAGALYESIDFTFSERVDSVNGKSAIVTLHTSSTPLHKPISIRMKTFQLSDSSHAFIAQLNGKGGFMRALASHWNGEWLEAESKYFGRFAVMEDLKAPSVYYPGGGSYFRNPSNSLDFHMTDGMSGIYDYDAYVDGKWLVAEYEPKQDRLRVRLEDVPESNSEHELRIVVKDLVGNVSTFEGIIYK